MKLKSRNKISANFNMSSMTDMIFILLIFFMIMTTLVDPNKKNALKVDLPKSSKHKVQKPEVTRVYITKDNQFYIDDKPVTESNLEQFLLQRLEGYQKPRVSLHADKDVPYENVVKVMTIARDNKYELILATKFK